MRTLFFLTALGLLLMTTGCTVVRPVEPEVGHYYIDPHVDFGQVGRVVVFELENETTNPEITEELTEALTRSLQKKHIFSIRPLYVEDPQWRKLDLNNTEQYDLQDYAAIREECRTDAVIFGSVTAYQGFPHLLISLHLKMVDLRDGRLLWAMEQIWDTTDKNTERRMKIFYHTKMRSGYEPMDWRLLITSRKAFDKFVVYEVMETFPDIHRYMGRPVSSENIKNFNEKMLLAQNFSNFSY